MNKLWQKEGPFGVWKGSNATFIYSVLQSLLENWSRSLFSALINVPDVGVGDIDRAIDLAAPYPWMSLVVATAASVVTALALAPLDLVRTRLMLTPSTHPPRRTVSLLQALPSYLCPSRLLLPTILHSLVHPVLTLSTPLVVRAQLFASAATLDQSRGQHPSSSLTFSIARFVASSACLFIKLPIETVLRRGQISVIKEHQRTLQAQQQPQQQQQQQQQSSMRQPPQPMHRKQESDASMRRRLAAPSRTTTPTTTPQLLNAHPPLETVVPTGNYLGVLGTMYHIIWQEGHRTIRANGSAAAPPPATPAAKASLGTTKKRRRQTVTKPTTAPATIQVRGQGMQGLWRGWKVSWWGLLGLWASSVVGNGGDGEF